MDLNQDILYVLVVLGILVGALQCFYGYRIFKFILGLFGFLLGGVLAAAIGLNFTQEVVVVFLFGLVGGFIGAALMTALYFVGVFVIGSFLGGILGVVLYAVAESNPDPVALLILAVIAGVIALVFQKFMIIVSTGFGGSWMVVIGVAFFATQAINFSNLNQIFRPDGSHLYAIILCWLALGIVGVMVQYRSSPTNVPQSPG
ncbi:DUF4203 domain-containing protein [Rhodohalobacter sp.]|uniref:TM7S3/TM198-like domain-containing protein n=1 Tax=Rhodohalobacter sp. TaxID=1974210 RepID=UPI0035678408